MTTALRDVPDAPDDTPPGSPEVEPRSDPVPDEAPDAEKPSGVEDQEP